MLQPLTQTFGDPIAHQNAMIQQAIVQNPELQTNMAQESGLWDSEDERQFFMDSRNAALEFQSQAWRMLQDQIMLNSDFFARFHSNGDESARYVNGDQMSDTDRANIFAEGRKPYEFDFISEYVKNICGEQISQRTEWNAVPLIPTMPEELQADIANHLLKWVSQSNDRQWPKVASAVFKDAIIRGMGVCTVRIDPDDPMSAIEIAHRRPQEFMWDIGSTLNGCLDGTTHLIRRYVRPRVELAMEYREWMNEILQMAPNLSTGYGTYDFYYNMMAPRVASAANKVEQSYQFSPSLSTIWGGKLPVCEMYHRRKVPRWSVYDGIFDRTYTFDNKLAATAARQMLFDYWTQSGMLQQLGIPTPVLSVVKQRLVTVVDQYTYIGMVMVRIVSQETENFPYAFYIPDWYDGTIVSFVERGKPRQRLVNRIMSHLDQMASGMKAQAVINKAYLSDKLTTEEIQEQFTQPGKIWVVDQPAGANFDASKVMHLTPVPNVGPVVLPFLNLVTESVKGAYGGSVQVGEPDYAQQSAASQEVLRSSGQLSRMDIYDAFQEFSEDVGKRAIYYAQYLDPTTRMRVINESGKADITSFIQAGIKDFGELQFGVIVAEKKLNPSEQARRYTQIIQLIGQMPETAPDWMPLLLKYIDVPYNDRTQVMQSSQARQQQQSQLAERSQQLMEQEQMTKDAVQKGNLMIKAAELDILARNPVKWNGQIKIPGTAELLQSMMQHGGIDIGAEQVAASIAGKALMDQDVRNLAQVSEQELWTPEQKKLQASKAAQIEHSVSQKDAVARSQKAEENVE